MINWSVILGIAKTHLLTKMKSTVTATLGVTFGIGAYITLVSFMTGLNAMLDDLVLNQTPHIHMYNEIGPSPTQPVALYDDFKDALNIVHSIKPKQSQKKIHNALPILNYLKKQPNVKGATPQLRAQIFYLSGSIELGGNLVGVDIMEEVHLSNVRDNIVEGSPEALKNNDNGILLGAGLADKMSLSVGDRVQVSTVNGNIFPLKIVGIYQSGIAEIDNVQSFVNLKTVQRILGEAENYVTDINVKLLDIAEAPSMAQSLEKQFNIKALDINEANAQFETGSNIRNLITYAVSITLLIVAGFGIYNILNMLIYEKMKDIAILKATGFSGTDVQLIFMSQAMIIGFVGGLLGLLIGFALSKIIDQTPFETEALPTITTYPVNYDPTYYAIGITFALISTFIAGYLPSNRAKKIDPVKIIRGT
ncbi:ABC transporter permease [Flagellimonas taeanensis]|uniref:Lipoprotein-releasing system permease protein n=1 Tax=Flagellimonas taeanensis TaxID=1005926 RepID=A0A1M6W9Y1_9FLAO|nr:MULTISPECIES: FtsX-like permease family protein [Allomuricauda]MDC6386636.1 ABC transporter permease [Muricauda sp. SK9]MEE1962747.1 FtsX-like permease family protein [Allomuricauda taeanensis]RIV51346.1 ABC transporter permease [Allomuricauda taeanensis]SFC45040.1 lipoprotein-releasing system permease protein [Allomuricauda taeanensis]SHK90570.1 lipoprotein-releasing system permease protein [Allomuricauda taeanensis]